MPPLTAANPTPDTDPAHFKGAFAPTPYPGTGAAYIADPARIGPVTGSLLPNFIDSTGKSRNHNIFRIEGPPGSALGIDPATGAVVDWIETTDFALMGRVFTGVMPGQVEVGRASYTRSATGQKLDVTATAVDSTQGRVPTQPRLSAVAPVLSFFDAPCDGTVDALGNILPPFSAPVGATETSMFASDGMYWGQAHPATIPSGVCVKDASARDAFGNLVPVYLPKLVTDEVTVTQALYDPALKTLTVAANSSDTVRPPLLTLGYEAFLGGLVGGRIVVPAVLAPPSEVIVRSGALGATKYQVSSAFPAPPVVVPAPVATDDSFTFPQNSAPQILNVLANDLNTTGGIVTVTTAPALGTAVVNLGGTLTYTPKPNATGVDTFAYTITVGTQVSNAGTVTLNITVVNQPPVAVDDTATAVIGKPLAIDVLANDTDPNGAADLAAAVNLTQPTPAGATVSVAGGTVTFTATLAGTYTFTYQAQDAGGLVSATPATVTVKVLAPDVITMVRSDYVVSKSNLQLEGTISPILQQTIRVDFVNSAGTVLGTAGTVVTAADGKWIMNKIIPLPVGSSAVLITSLAPEGGIRVSTLNFK
ncbi:MAG: hypothetical protein HYU75_15955 [Betaproteobacteria bacterium]|nr:hypothetical protein [Betaproteobacteria bacterium]